MRLMLQRGSEESARHQAIKLMGCLIMNIAMAYAALDALYVELKVAGGFFRGRKMFAEVDQQMRYELVGYITALTAVLVREALREPDEVDSIVTASCSSLSGSPHARPINGMSLGIERLLLGIPSWPLARKYCCTGFVRH